MHFTRAPIFRKAHTQHFDVDKSEGNSLHLVSILSDG